MGAVHGFSGILLIIHRPQPPPNIDFIIIYYGHVTSSFVPAMVPFFGGGGLLPLLDSDS